MKTLAGFVFALLPFAALAAGPFDGKWKTQLDTLQYSARPDAYELKDGVYTCSTCVPPISVKADGSDQPVAGHSYYDTMAVKQVDAHSVQVDSKLQGKLIFSSTVTASADGNTLSSHFRDMSGTQAVTGTFVEKRVSAGAIGAHAISGKWQAEKLPEFSDLGATIAYRMTGDGLQMEWNGQSYDAKFDGKQVLTKNDPGKTMVSLKRISDHVIEETDTRDGKVTDITLMTVSADGASMTVVDKDMINDMTTSFVMKKLP